MLLDDYTSQVTLPDYMDPSEYSRRFGSAIAVPVIARGELLGALRAHRATTLAA